MKNIIFLNLVLFSSCEVLDFGGDKDICQCDIELTFTDLVFDNGDINNVTTTINSGQLTCRIWFNSTDRIQFNGISSSGYTGSFELPVSESLDWDINNTRCRGGILDG